jgi:probable HAF family extracellular repeat protein
MRDLGTLGGVSSVAFAIDGSGRVFGQSGTRDGNVRAFVWTTATGMRLADGGGRSTNAVAVSGGGDVLLRADDGGAAHVSPRSLQR